MVSTCIPDLIGTVFSLKTINWRLLHDFGPFTGTARDALTCNVHHIHAALIRASLADAIPAPIAPSGPANVRVRPLF
jgi:hypothetical protein